MSSESEAKLNFVRYAVARELLRGVAETLRPHALPVMPLKGVWLHACVYAAPERRRITDVDVLVPESRHPEARAILARAGWVESARNVAECMLVHPDHALSLDLHARLFTPGSFGLPTERLFARATPDATRFGVEVWLPDPLDGLGHLIGHFVKSRGRAADVVHLRDFARVGHAFALDPASCAERLSESGLARAARYALCCAHAHEPDPFLLAVLDALPPDPLGALLARGVLRLDLGATSGALGALPGFVLERSLPGGAHALWRRLRDRRHEHARVGAAPMSPNDVS